MEVSAITYIRQRPSMGITILAVLALTMIGAAVLLPPIAQPQAFHAFAEQRMLLGVPHFGDVLSNLAYAIVAFAGFAFLMSWDGQRVFNTPLDRLPYFVFFGAIAAVAIGSTYYHMNPTNQTLFWDRLPMVVAFTSLLAAFLTDRVHAKMGALVILPLAILLGVISLGYWHISETAGQGDLRFYFLVQASAFLLVPLTCVLFHGNHTSGKYVAYMLLFYGLGVTCEQFDIEIHELLDDVVSGHTIKHFLTALAVYMVVPMLRQRRPIAPLAT